MKITVEQNLFRSFILSLVPTIFWLAIIYITISLLPHRAWYLKYYGVLISLTIIGIWRYVWQLIHIVRAFLFNHFYFPKIREKTFHLESNYPHKLFFVVPSYKESPEVSNMCFGTIVEECSKIESNVTVVASVGSEEEITFIKNLVDKRLDIKFLLQHQGKRKALADALQFVANLSPNEDDLIIIMDGDSALCSGCLSLKL